MNRTGRKLPRRRRPDEGSRLAPRQVTIHEAKTHLSRLVQEVLAGRPIVIARGHDPVVRLVPVEPPREREFGAFKGRIAIGPEFFDPLPDEELAAWGEE